MSADAEIYRAGERLVLMPERAVWWPQGRTVFCADTHFGKDSTFRAASIPIPTGTTSADLDRLDTVISRTRSRRLVVLGDFFHASSGRSVDVMGQLDSWRERNNTLEIVVVRGNHDEHAGDLPHTWNTQMIDGPVNLPPFVLSHDALTGADGYVLSGHVHPGVRLRGPGGQRVVLPCFRMGTHGAVLPPFGSFTGLHVVRPAKSDEVFVIADDAVHPVTG